MSRPQKKYSIWAPPTPGATPTRLHSSDTLRGARKLAYHLLDRRDLTYQDVRIERPDGSLVEHAGPSR